jgi:hypothetical protein
VIYQFLATANGNNDQNKSSPGAFSRRGGAASGVCDIIVVLVIHKMNIISAAFDYGKPRYSNFPMRPPPVQTAEQRARAPPLRHGRSYSCVTQNNVILLYSSNICILLSPIVFGQMT